MTTYELTQKQRQSVKKDGYVMIVRNGRRIRVTPSMVTGRPQKKKREATQSKPLTRFGGKQTLTPSDIRALIRGKNNNMIDIIDWPENGFDLTPDQVEKGRRFLLNSWVTPRGEPRKNSPFGYRETAALKTFKTIRLVDLVDECIPPVKCYRPVYEVEGSYGDFFQYYVSGGKPVVIG